MTSLVGFSAGSDTTRGAHHPDLCYFPPPDQWVALQQPRCAIRGRVTLHPTLVRLEVTSTRASGSCPRCGIRSDQVHSADTRTVADVPCAGRLKMLKRQMYGRASFSLLRRRVLPDLARPP